MFQNNLQNIVENLQRLAILFKPSYSLLHTIIHDDYSVILWFVLLTTRLNYITHNAQRLFLPSSGGWSRAAANEKRAGYSNRKQLTDGSVRVFRRRLSLNY